MGQAQSGPLGLFQPPQSTTSPVQNVPQYANQLPVTIPNQRPGFNGNIIPGFPNPALIPYGLWQNAQFRPGNLNLTSPVSFDNLFRNAANLGLNPNYLKWKKEADYADYLDARKYFAWKQAARGNAQDWDQYENWKNNVWKNVQNSAYTNDFKNWKSKLDQEDAQKWKEWNEWKKTKDETSRKNLRKVNRNYDKNKRAYEHFNKRAEPKEYAKFVKFQDWAAWARDQNKNIDDMNSYYKWSDNYIYNAPLITRQYEQWKNKPNPQDFRIWVQWMKWDKVRKEAQSLSEVESKHGKKHGQKYKAWYKNEGEKNFGCHGDYEGGYRRNNDGDYSEEY